MSAEDLAWAEAKFLQKLIKAQTEAVCMLAWRCQDGHTYSPPRAPTATVLFFHEYKRAK